MVSLTSAEYQLLLSIFLFAPVPPRRVEILHQSSGGEAYRVSEAELLHLPQGVLTTITCRVTVTDTDFAPDVTLTSDGQDVTSRFTHNSTTVANEAHAAASARQGFALLPERIYDYQLKVDPTGNDVASLVHGKNLTCLASLQHFKPIKASVRLEVACKCALYKFL